MKDRLLSIKQFSDAGVIAGEMRVERADKEFEQTGHSCYDEGWAAGYLYAMQIINEYVSREYEEAKADEAA